MGSLWWPTGANRFGIATLLATDQNVYNIRQQLQSAGVQSDDLGNTLLYGPGELLMSEEDQQFQTVGKITASSMWMLPPRPLVSITGQNGMNLLTLVDSRFFWWFRDSGVISIDEGETTWGDLFDQIAQALGVNIDYDDISAAYLEPGHGLAAQYEQTPMLLDAVAYNVGQRIVVDLDGTVHSYNQASSQEILQGTVNLLQQSAPKTLYMMGGGFFSDQDGPILLPSAVRVTFPRSVGYVDLDQSYAVEVTLGNLNLEELGTVGNGNVKTFHDTCAAEGATGSAPTNAVTLATLATQIAEDWYLYQLGPLDAKFQGVVNWGIEGLSDSVEWVYVKGEISTRVMRPAWNDLTEELLHGPAPVNPPAWIKVINATSQTITLTPNSSRNISAIIYEGGGTVIDLGGTLTENDVGASVSGTGIQSSTTILNANSPSEAVISKSATASLDNVTLTIQDTNLTTTGYYGVVEIWDNAAGEWLYWDAVGFQWVTDNGSVNWTSVTPSVWFQDVNGDAATYNRRYQCRLLGQDENGVPMWGTAASLSIPNSKSSISSYVLTTSWSNTGLSLSLPANTTWFVTAQLNAQLSSSPSGDGDTISCRFFDGTTQYGETVQFCTAPCPTVNTKEAATLTWIVAVGASAITLSVQGIINTSSGSTASMLGCTLVGGQWG